MSSEIDLAQEPMKLDAPMPEGGLDTNEAEPNYPELHINDSTDPSLMDLPDHGMSMIKHTVIHRGEHTHKGKKGKRYSVHLRVHSIKGVKHLSKKGHKKAMEEDEDKQAVKEYFGKKHAE